MERPPHPALAPYVRTLWVSRSQASSARERALPTGTAHLVLRIEGPKILLYKDVEDDQGCTYGHAVLGGPRARFYVRDTSAVVSSVGVQFRAGGATALLGIPGGELAGRHVPLDALAMHSALHEQLSDAQDAASQLRILEDALLSLLPKARPLHPAVAYSLARLERGSPAIATLCRETGWSHRRLLTLFEDAVGLNPKVYSRILRFQEAIRMASAGVQPRWAELALRCGFSDQSHLNREFRSFAGLSPGAYRPSHQPNHVPIAD